MLLQCSFEHAPSKLNKLLNSRGISTSVKVKLLRSLIISTALYGSETWTYNKKMQKRAAAFKLRCFRRILGITWKQKIPNAEVKNKIKQLIGEYEPLLEFARRRKLQWFGHVSRKPGTMAYTIMHRMVEGNRGKGRPQATWLKDIAYWTGNC